MPSNLALEGVLRCAVTLVAVAAGLGVPGAAAGLLISLPAALLHTRRAQARLSDRIAEDAAATPAEASRARHDAMLALAALGLLAVLQNVDVLVLGRKVPGQQRQLRRGVGGLQGAGADRLRAGRLPAAGGGDPASAAGTTTRSARWYVSLGFVAAPLGDPRPRSRRSQDGHPLLSLAFGQRLAGAVGCLHCRSR